MVTIYPWTIPRMSWGGIAGVVLAYESNITLVETSCDYTSCQLSAYMTSMNTLVIELTSRVAAG